MASQHTFPQTGDNDDAENFGQMIGRDNATGYVSSGMGLSVDYGVPEVTISTGVAFVKQSSATASSTGETRLDVGYVVQTPQQTKSLADGDNNYVYLQPNLGTNDNGQFIVYQDESNASSSELQIARITTGITQEAVAKNRSPDGSFEQLTAQSLYASSSTLDIYDSNSDHIAQFDGSGNLDITGELTENANL